MHHTTGLIKEGLPLGAALTQDDWKYVFWFDTEVKGFARGVPESELDQFMCEKAGPFVITQRHYRSPGQVAAVIIECAGGLQTEAARRSIFDVTVLRNFIHENYELTCLYREYRGQDIAADDGRFYADFHDPSYPDVPTVIGSDWRVDPSRQSKSDRERRLQEARCPVHGLMVEHVGLSGRRDFPFTVRCPRPDCGVLGRQAHPGGPIKLVPLFNFLLE